MLRLMLWNCNPKASLPYLFMKSVFWTYRQLRGIRRLPGAVRCSSMYPTFLPAFITCWYMMESASRYCSKLWLKNEEHADTIVKILKTVKAPEKFSGAFLFEKTGRSRASIFLFYIFLQQNQYFIFIIYEIF